MTNQMADKVTWEERTFEIAGKKMGRLLTPFDFGMVPVRMSTACHRGYISTYSVIDNGLFLTELLVRTEDEAYPPIGGREPKRHETFACAHYTNLQVVCAFTGGLLLVDGLISARGILPDPVSYRTVKEVLFNDGQIEIVVDHSELFEEVRSKREDERRPWPLAPGYKGQPPLFFDQD